MVIKKILKIIWAERKSSPFRIIAKSYARYKRFGYRGMLRRLNREYYALFPLANNPKELDKIYTIWQKKKERRLLEDRVDSKRVSFLIVSNLDSKNEDELNQMLSSLEAQNYTNWELKLYIKEPPKSSLLNVINSFLKLDKKIKLIKDSKIEKLESRADYILYLGSRDTLAPNVLSALAKEIEKSSNLELIYSDEDYIDENSKRYNPYFKPSWSLDLFLSYNYIGSLWCLKRELFNKINRGFDFSQASQYSLLLSAIFSIKETQISHIPKVLYHRRVKRLDKRVFPAQITSKEAYSVLNSFKKEIGAISIEEGLFEGSCRVKYPIKEPPPLVTIIIPTKDKLYLLKRCIDSILQKSTYKNYEILIVDNQSQELNTLEYLRDISKNSKVKVLEYNHPFNYSAINNYAVSKARGEVLILLNNDIEVITPSWIEEMLQHALRSEIGAVGAMLYYDNFTIQHAGVVLGLGGVAGHSHKYFPKDSLGYFGRLKATQNYSAVTGACLMVKKSHFLEVGGLEESLKVAFNDVDFCLKLLERGYKNLWTPYAELFHHESKSRGADDTPKKKKRFESEVEYMKKRWGNLLLNDRYYNPNLTQFFEDFRIDIE